MEDISQIKINIENVLQILYNLYIERAQYILNLNYITKIKLNL